MGMRESFLENGRFFTKYGHERRDFSRENRKRGNLLTFLDHIECSFDSIDAFLTKYGHDATIF